MEWSVVKFYICDQGHSTNKEPKESKGRTWSDESEFMEIVMYQLIGKEQEEKS